MEMAAKISLLVYGILMMLGGIFGFVKAKSKASLISGVVSGVLLIVSYFVSSSNANNGLLMGLGITSLLAITFAIRLSKTKKFMPSGMLLILTIIEEVLLLFATFVKV